MKRNKRYYESRGVFRTKPVFHRQWNADDRAELVENLIREDKIKLRPEFAAQIRKKKRIHLWVLGVVLDKAGLLW